MEEYLSHLEDHKKSVSLDTLVHDYLGFKADTRSHLMTILDNQCRIIAAIENRPKEEVWNEVKNELIKNQEAAAELTLENLDLDFESE